MSGPPKDESRRYVVEFEYTEDGYQIPFRMDDWMEMVREDFASFTAIQEFWRTSPDEIEDFLEENFEEVDEDEEGDVDSDRPVIHFKNPPQHWVDDPSSAMPIVRALDMMRARMGLWVLSEEEYEAEEELLEEGRFKEALVRQSAFFEDYLTLQCQLEFQSLKEETLTNNELRLIEKMGHKPRIRLARLLGIVDKKEHDLLLNLAKRRNQIAHTSWTDFDEDDETIFRQIATRVHEMEEKWMEEAERAAEQEAEAAEDWDRESTVQDVESELLTIAVLNTLQALDSPASLSQVAAITTYSEAVLRKQCDQLIKEGLVRPEGDQTYRITRSGEERLEELS